MDGRDVYALVIECGRGPGDDLPDGAVGARMVCYAPGVDEEAAIEAATAVIREAGMLPGKATSHGNLAQRLARGEATAGERSLMRRVERDRRVVIAELTPLFAGD
jgi:hypothetical protein